MKQMTVLTFLGAVLWICAILLCRPAAAEEIRILDEPDLRITIRAAEKTPESVKVFLTCENRTDQEEPLLFLVPKADGSDTVFGNGWPSEELILPPGTSQEEELEFLAPEETAAFERLSLRFSYRGQLSSESVLCPPELSRSVPAGFGVPETQMVREAVRVNPDSFSDPILLQDRIPPERTALLDYGQAWICLKTEDALLPFCRIPLAVDVSGRAEARYSGLAAAFDREFSQPLEVTETDGEGIIRLETREISLTGESVFYATLKVTLEGNRNQGFRVARQELSSSELGGTYGKAPMGLADTAEALLRVLEKTDAPADVIDTRSQFLTLTEPVSLHVFSAFDLGEICVYFEYFFTDGTDLIHPPAGLNQSSRPNPRRQN